MRQRRRRRWKRGLLAALVVALVGAAVWAIWFSDLLVAQKVRVSGVEQLTEEQVDEKLSALELDYVMLDTVDFKKDYPKYSVVEQDPLPGEKVKEDRKIYIKINSSGFSSVRIPDLIEKTLRQAKPTLEAMGLEVGKITYKPYLGKDMVLEMQQDGKKLTPGTKVLKSSKIDLVLGYGKVVFEETEPDDVTMPEPVDEP